MAVLKTNSAKNPTVLFFSALDEEADAMGSVLRYSGFRSIPSLYSSSIEHRVYSRADYERGVYYVLVKSKHMGKLNAAVTATLACMEFAPSFVFVIGIAGRFKNGLLGKSSFGLCLGDEIVADEIYDIDVRKILTPDYQVLKRVTRFALPQLTLALAWKASSSHGWYTHCPPAVRKSIKPSVHFGPVVSGDAVWAADDLKSLRRLVQGEFITATSRSPIGIEMEGAGVALAVERVAGAAGFLMLRGVSDFADSRKQFDELVGRQLARFTASSLAISIINDTEFEWLLRNRGFTPFSSQN